MRRLYIFRTDLKILESYHSIINLDEFKNNCWDFYLIQCIWFLENNEFDECVIWRLFNSKKDDIIFTINGKKFIQRWVKDFRDVFTYPSADVSFFRGGFPSYCAITNSNEKFFGLKLYLAAGKRLVPQYGGIYDKILIESENDNIDNNRCIPFYKTANANIFKSLNLSKEYDLCIVSNFTQLKYKGTDFIISQIPNREYYENLKICHIGNNPEVGEKLCKQYGVSNIDFLGKKDRVGVNEVLNKSKFTIVASNREDGCPRVITESLCSGTPLFLKSETRLLEYYKKYGIVSFNNQGNLFRSFVLGYGNYDEIKESLQKNMNRLSMDTICKMNLNLWRNL
jgi:hypothetical protein